MLKTLTPQQKKIAIALAGAAVLAVIALLSRNRGAAAGAAEQEDPGEGKAAPFGSTFADNGEAAGGLSTAITEGLGNVAIGLEGVTAQQGYVGEQLGALAAERAAQQAAVDQMLGAAVIATPTIQTPAAPAAAATARTARPTPAGAFRQRRGTRAGRDYKVVVRGRVKSRFYESKPGAKDFGKKPTDRIVVGPSSKAEPKPKTKAPRKPPKAKTKAPSSPSKRPAATPRPPAAKKKKR